jgi:hypothetical protein
MRSAKPRANVCGGVAAPRQVLQLAVPYVRFAAADARRMKDQQEIIVKANLGPIDRTIRIIAGVGLIAATLMGAIGPWGWLGLVPLATGLLRFCPAYTLFGIRTCAASK